MSASIEPVPGRARRPAGRQRPVHEGDDQAVPSCAPADAHAIGPVCDIDVPRPAMWNTWSQLTFLHWSYDPEAVQALLPAGLTVDTFDDKAWVGLVPFVMEVRPPVGPAVPWLSRFCETNVRTYAIGPDGTRGVWFLSLEAARLPAVATARAAYRLPYFWASMSFERRGDIVTYRSRRRWPGPGGTASLARVRIGQPFGADELGPLDHFLTARWRLYFDRLDRGRPWRRRPPAPSRSGHPGLGYALAQHDPWPLRRVDVLDLDDHLMTAAGLPAPTGDPLAHWSDRIDVALSLPRRLPER